MKRQLWFVVIIVFLGSSVYSNIAYSGVDRRYIPINPRINNGSLTHQYPFVASLLFRPNQNSPWNSKCSATLISPYTLVTAGHCLCDSSGTSCQQNQINTPNKGFYKIFLQSAGFFEIESIAIPLNFIFPYNDYAIINLTTPVQGITTAGLSEVVPPTGIEATIVGYGLEASGFNEYAGLKRVGEIETVSCLDKDIGLTDEFFICWHSTLNTLNANTCVGDSGGALLVNNNGLFNLAGITSGGSYACDGVDFSFDTAVAAYRDEIIESSVTGLSTATLGSQLSETLELNGVLDFVSHEAVLEVNTNIKTKRLVVTGNSEDFLANQYQLTVYDNSLSPEQLPLCQSNDRGVFHSCVLSSPIPETLRVVYERLSGVGGEYQLTLSEYEPVCSLDVDGDGQFEALTDGLLIIRYLFGFQGNVLINNAVNNRGLRKTAGEISQFLDQQQCLRDLDVDGDGVVGALSDGLLILRFLFDFTGEVLINNTLNERSIRRTEQELTNWLFSLKR